MSVYFELFPVSDCHGLTLSKQKVRDHYLCQIIVDNDIIRIRTLCAFSELLREIQTNNLYTIKSVTLSPSTDSSIDYFNTKPGIGTYNKSQYHTRTFSAIASAIDKAIALHLNDHVKDGCALSTRHF